MGLSKEDEGSSCLSSLDRCILEREKVEKDSLKAAADLLSEIVDGLAVRSEFQAEVWREAYSRAGEGKGRLLAHPILCASAVPCGGDTHHTFFFLAKYSVAVNAA